MNEVLLIKVYETLYPLRGIIFLDFVNAYTLHNLWIAISTVLFSYLSFLAGGLLLRIMRVDASTGPKRFVYRIFLGYGIFGIFGLLLGLAGLFNAFFLRLFAIIVILASFGTIAAHVRVFAGHVISPLSALASFKRGIFGKHRALKFITVLWLFVNFFIVFVPVTGWDALNYHLPIIANLIEEGRLTFTPAIQYYQRYPVFAEIIYAVPMVIFGNTFAPGTPSAFPPEMPLGERVGIFNAGAAPFVFQLLQYGMLLLLLVLIYDFLKQRVENKFLLYAVPIFILAISDLQREVMHGGYVDIFVFGFGLAGLFLVLENILAEKINFTELYIAAVLFGMALAMKYTTLLILAIAGLLLVTALFRAGAGVKAAVRHLSAYAAIISLIAGFWYAKNFIWFGNPVYPIFSDSEFARIVGWFIVERTPVNFFLFPFYVFGQWFVNPDETSSRLIVLGYFILVYALLVFLLAWRRTLTVLEACLLFFIEMYLLFSFIFSHQIRFMLPALVLLVIFLVLLADRLYTLIKLRFGERLYYILGRISYAGLVALSLALLLGYIHYFRVRFNYITGNYTEAEYIADIGWQ